MVWDFASNVSGEVIAGVIGGLVGAALKETTQYILGWRQAGANSGADFHIAGTMYPEINPADPTHKDYLPALEEGKTHAQELVWLSAEVSLNTFLGNRYLFRQVSSAMAKAKDAGILIDKLPERAQRPLLKKVAGYHSTIPYNGIVEMYKRHVGVEPGGRVLGISPPTHEHYAGSPHRRVLRAMFIADSQIENGLPPRNKIYFEKNGHAYRYDTLLTIIEDYKNDPEKYDRVRAFF